jgi:hypothetical protein
MSQVRRIAPPLTTGSGLNASTALAVSTCGSGFPIASISVATALQQNRQLYVNAYGRLWTKARDKSLISIDHRHACGYLRTDTARAWGPCRGWGSSGDPVRPRESGRSARAIRFRTWLPSSLACSAPQDAQAAAASSSGLCSGLSPKALQSLERTYRKMMEGRVNAEQDTHTLWTYGYCKCAVRKN